MKRIHLISGPRNISTALMYSFAQRADTRVVDEPLYAHYLSTHPEVDHPGRAEILGSMSQDWKQVVSQVILGSYDREVVFLKGMSHHLVKMELDWLSQVTNLFLIRNPRQLIASFAQVIEQPIMRDIGLDQSYRIWRKLDAEGQCPVVLDSNELLKDPPKMMPRLCEALGIPADESMLRWAAGPRPEDGVWAPYWYANVHGSTGFKKQETSTRSFPSHLQPLLDEAMPFYEHLSVNALKL
ncbi:MAG TPA: sulfotransferase family protein [Cytophagales bacterium]|nr:sulfotransferase family protein [Cytophagales bacterium]HAA23704.1 sulfotransferase family protein [Cytophagales bacterium]HAP62859.1 sulfotransferase family protein [Cytophagales bacterium]